MKEKQNERLHKTVSFDNLCYNLQHFELNADLQLNSNWKLVLIDYVAHLTFQHAATIMQQTVIKWDAI